MHIPPLPGTSSQPAQLLLILTLSLSKAHASDVLAPNWNRGTCLQTITAQLLRNSTSIPPSYFASPPPTSVSNTTNYILTIPGCRALCGSPSRSSYWSADAGVRLITWLLPILLMVANVPFAGVGRGRFATVAVLLGNPVQFVWGMVLELEGWKAAWRVAGELMAGHGELAMCLGRAIAVYQKIGRDPCVLEKMDEVKELWRRRLSIIAGERGTHSNDGRDEEGKRCAKVTAGTSITQLQPDEAKLSHPSSASQAKLLRALDNELADFRRTEILRALLASTVYILLTLASFSSKLSDGSPASGGKIGPAALLAFLLVSVGLGNAVGDFQYGGCEKAFRRFFEGLGRPNEALPNNTYRSSHIETGCLRRPNTITPAMKALAWAGGMPIYRARFRVGTWPRMCARFVLSVMPLNIAFAASTAVLTTPPVYFSCRSKLVISIYSLWLLSFFVNWIMSRLPFASGKYLFRIVILKDSIVAIANLAFINLASAGWGNTCECWGKVTGAVQLNPAGVFDFNNEMRYPAVIGGCFALQVLTLGIILLPNRRGYYMMWRKSASDEDFAHLFYA